MTAAACGPGGEPDRAAGDLDAGDRDLVCLPAQCAPYGCDPETHRCLTVCATTDDCTPGFVCDQGFCVGTQCTAETAIQQCGGYACVGGNCGHDCALGACTEGFYCRGDTGECVTKCTSREDITCEGYLCDVASGECEPYCLSGELGCAPGYQCDAELQCVPSAE